MKYFILAISLSGCAVTGVNQYVIGIDAEGKEITQKVVSQAPAVQPLGGHSNYSTVWHCTENELGKEICKLQEAHWVDSSGYLLGLAQPAAIVAGGYFVGRGLRKSGDTVSVNDGNVTQSQRQSQTTPAPMMPMPARGID